MAKGIALSLAEILFGLVTVGIALMIIFTFYAKYFDIQVFVKSNEVDRHTIDVSQVILSSPLLVYKENEDTEFERNLRGVFDEEKIRNLDSNQFLSEISYPNSILTVVIADLETKNAWSYVGKDIITLESSNFIELLGCVIDHIDVGFFKFTPGTGFGLIGLWDIWDLTACGAIFGERVGTGIRTYPLLIRTTSGDLHIGQMMVRLDELFI